MIDFYRKCAPDAGHEAIELDQRIWSIRQAIAENTDYVPGCYLFPLGYVVFASNVYGDAYCLDLTQPHAAENCPVVLFPHDEVEEETSVEDVEKYRLVVAENLEDFVRKFARRTLTEKPDY